MSDAVLVGPVVPDRRDLLAVVAAVALVALLVANRPPAIGLHRSTATAQQRAASAGIDVDQVVDRVSHALQPTAPGILTTGDRSYRARFDASGFAVAPVGHASGLHVALRTGSALASEPWTGDGNVASRAVGDDVTERVTATKGSVEWDVVIAHRPAGHGGLRIAADLGGLASARTVAGHWALRLAGGGTMRIGALVVKDRTGRVLHRALPSIAGRHLAMVVPTQVLDTARYPLVVDPSVSVERDVGTVAADGDQTTPAVAWNGSSYLAVWADTRVDGNNLVATRVTASGGVLDPDGIPIPTGHWGVTAPSIASDGTNFLVVWGEPRNGNHTQDDVFGERITPAGALLDPVGLTISDQGTSEIDPVVAWNGTDYLVAWGGSQAAGMRVTSSGTDVDPKPILITNTGSPANVAIASDGTNWIVSWTDFRAGNGAEDVYADRVSGSGTVLDGAGFPIANATDQFEASPAIAWNGSDYLVVYADQDSVSSVFHVDGKRVASTGTLVDTSPITVSAGGIVLNPAVTARGSTFYADWAQLRIETSSWDTMAARVSSNGTVADTTNIPVGATGGHELSPAIAGGASSVLAVWQVGRDTIDVVGGRIGGSGAVLDPNGVTLSAGPPPDFEWTPSIAWNGSVFLVVWEDGRSNSTEDIYGARIDPTGAVLDPTGIPISTATDGQYAPAVASNGTNFLVAWEDFRNGSNYDIRGARVTTAGAVLGDGIPISTAANDQQYVSVGWNGTDYLVAWQDHRSGTSDDIYSTRVSPGGTVRSPSGKAVSTSAGDQRQPSVATTDGTTIVVWTDTRNAGVNIRGSRVNTSGTALDTSGILITGAAGDQTSPVVAWTGGTYLVAWTDGRNGSNDIYGTRLNASGVVQDASGIPISTATGNQDEPAIAVNGTFLVVWRDSRSGSTYDVFGSRVGDDGSVKDPNGFGVAAGVFHEFNPAVTAGPGGTWAVAYSRSQFTGQGTYLRTVSPK